MKNDRFLDESKHFQIPRHWSCWSFEAANDRYKRPTVVTNCVWLWLWHEQRTNGVLSPPQRRGALTATQTFCRVFCCPVRVGAAALRLHAPMHVVNDRDNNNFPISTIKWEKRIKTDRSFAFPLNYFTIHEIKSNMKIETNEFSRQKNQINFENY